MHGCTYVQTAVACVPVIFWMGEMKDGGVRGGGVQQTTVIWLSDLPIGNKIFSQGKQKCCRFLFRFVMMTEQQHLFKAKYDICIYRSMLFFIWLDCVIYQNNFIESTWKYIVCSSLIRCTLCIMIIQVITTISIWHK